MNYGINTVHFRKFIIEPALILLQFDSDLPVKSEAAVNLLLGTAAQESAMGHYLMQNNEFGQPAGPAVGIYQMQPETHYDIWDQYILRGDKKKILFSVCNMLGIPADKPEIPSSSKMISNMLYATVMARLHYWRDPEPLAAPGDIDGHGRIWKRVYNTPAGKGTVDQFVKNYLNVGIQNLESRSVGS